MEYSINLDGALMPRRITIPLPSNMSIESGIVSTIKTSLYKSIIKQVEIYDRMNENPSDNFAGETVVGMLGTPLFSDVTLQSTSDPARQITLDTALVTISRAKNIGRSTVTGRNGTVKEYFSMDDFEISISGQLTDEIPTRYPQEAVTLLKKLLEMPEAIKISGPFFAMFEIFNVVVYNYKFDQKEGLQNAQFFEIKMWSDTPVELEKVS
jgi:hypothetical protein